MKQLFISKVVMEQYDCSEKFECLSTINGNLYDRSERYLLHKAIGSMGDMLCRKSFGVCMKDIQELISEQQVLPLLQCGVIELVEPSEFEKCFNDLYCFNKTQREWIRKAKLMIEPFFNSTKLSEIEKTKLINSVCEKLVKC